MINEIVFGEKGTYSDFGLLMTGRIVGHAPLKRKSVDIPWRDGKIDYTQAGGRTFYDNRQLSFDFKLIDPDEFYTVYTALAEYIHGQHMRVTIPEDRSYYYEGMCEVSDLEVSKRLGTITITVDADPYKYSKSSPTEDIPWDDVNFEETIFRTINRQIDPVYGTTIVNGEIIVQDTTLTTIDIPKGGLEVVPIFYIANDVQDEITLEQYIDNDLKNIVTLYAGRNRFPSLKVCGNDDVELRFYKESDTNVIVRIEYREARL